MKDIKLLIELCLSRCYFLWNNEFHELEDSGPIGLSLMVVIAEGFLQSIEKVAMRIALRATPPSAPITYRRYVDDSHSRFLQLENAYRFKDILNQQNPKVQYTMEIENEGKELPVIGINVKNEGEGKYEFEVHRKKAITNIQVKPHSDHDPKILRGIFKGFLHRAMSICSEKYLESEIEFLINIFNENGYERGQLQKIVDEVKQKNNEQVENDETVEEGNVGMVTLPWVPGLSPKLRKMYKKAGVKVVFKSGANLCNLLTYRNKNKLPINSNPGVYRIPCKKHPENPYIGETKLQIRTRKEVHKGYVAREKWEESGAASHSRLCKEVEWEKIETLKVERHRFDRKVREALEIQLHKSGPENGGMNKDWGDYVKTKFWLPYLSYPKRAVRNKMTSNNPDNVLTSETTATQESE